MGGKKMSKIGVKNHMWGKKKVEVKSEWGVNNEYDNLVIIYPILGHNLPHIDPPPPNCGDSRIIEETHRMVTFYPRIHILSRWKAKNNLGGKK